MAIPKVNSMPIINRAKYGAEDQSANPRSMSCFSKGQMGNIFAIPEKTNSPKMRIRNDQEIQIFLFSMIQN